MLRDRPPRGRGPHDPRARPATTARPLLSLTAPDPRTQRAVARTLRPNPPGDPAVIAPDLRRPDARPGAVAVPPRSRPARTSSRAPAQRHHARQLAADRLPARPAGRRARRRAGHARAARELSLCLLYWLQTEAPGGRRAAGRAALRRRPRQPGRARQGARTSASRGVSAASTRGRAGPPDVRGEPGRRLPRLGGHRHVPDRPAPLHGRRPLHRRPCRPFQIPLGALLPVRLDNLLAAAKNIAHHAHHQRRLPAAPGRVERREAAGPGRVLPGGRHRCRARCTAPGLLAVFQAELAGVELAWPPGVARLLRRDGALDEVDDRLGRRARREDLRHAELLELAMSCAGIVPPTVTTTSPASCSRSSATTRGTSVMCAPLRIREPDRVGVLLQHGLDDLLGVWCRPV